jgi:hypothetical protein
VWIVAGDAAQLHGFLAFLEALACVHLLDLPDELGIDKLGRSDEHRPEKVQRQPRAEGIHFESAPDDANRSLEMALLAHGLTQSVREMPRVDDGQILPVTSHAFLPGDMQFAWTVTPFTSDRMTPKDRLLVSVHCLQDWFNPVCMTKEAVGPDCPLEAGVAAVVAG